MISDEQVERLFLEAIAHDATGRHCLNPSKVRLWLEPILATVKKEDRKRIEELERELAEVKRDAKRYRWLVKNRAGWFWKMLSYHPNKSAEKSTFDEAIDAALSQQEGESDDK